MNWLQQYQVLTFANLVICSAGGFVCACRVNQMRFDTTRQLVRLLYALVVVALTLNGGWYWFFGGFADWQNVVASVSIIVVLMIDARSWREGLPQFAKSGPAPLQEVPSTTSLRPVVPKQPDPQ